MQRVAFEILKWLPLIALPMNFLIAWCTARETARSGRSPKSFLLMMGWFLLVIILLAIAAS